MPTCHFTCPLVKLLNFCIMTGMRKLKQLWRRLGALASLKNGIRAVIQSHSVVKCWGRFLELKFKGLCLQLGKALKKVGFTNTLQHEFKKFQQHRSRAATAKSCTKKCDALAKMLRFSSCSFRHRCECFRLSSLILKTKDLFIWRWGTPARHGNPPRWGNPPVHTISHFNLITFTWWVG